jgi:hypothetical protein
MVEDYLIYLKVMFNYNNIKFSTLFFYIFLGRKKLQALEDYNNNVVIAGLKELTVSSGFIFCFIFCFFFLIFFFI